MKRIKRFYKQPIKRRARDAVEDVSACREPSYTAAHYRRDNVKQSADGDSFDGKQCKQVKTWLSEWERVRPTKKERKQLYKDALMQPVIKSLEQTARQLHTWYTASLEGRFLVPPDSLRLIACGLEQDNSTDPRYSEQQLKHVHAAYSYDCITGDIERNEPLAEWYSSAANHGNAIKAWENSPTLPERKKSLSVFGVVMSRQQLAFTLAYGDVHGYAQKIGTGRKTNGETRMLAMDSVLLYQTADFLTPDKPLLMYNRTRTAIVGVSSGGASPESLEFYRQYEALCRDGKAARAVQFLQRAYWDSIKDLEFKDHASGYLLPAREVIFNRALAYYQKRIDLFHT